MKTTLISALKISGNTLLKLFNKPLETKLKQSQSNIVTEADFKSDALILDLIRNEFMDHNIISEESGYLNNGSEYTWVVDPLDGTSNFAAGIPWFGILISLFHNNVPIMGGAYLPVTDTLYFAERGKGAFRDGTPIKMNENKELCKSLVAFSVDYTEDIDFLTKGIEIYTYLIKGSRNIRSTNSLVDFIYVAEGKFGGCINLFTKVWDISALGLIILEAGGLMIDTNGNEILYSLEDSIMERNFPVIAGSKEIVKSLRCLVL